MESAGELAVRRMNWRLFLAPVVALALLVGYVIYTQVGSGSPARSLGAPATAPKPTKVTAADLLLAASAAKSIHLEFDNVTGGPSAVHTNHAVVTSFSWGVSTPFSPTTAPGSGTAKPNVQFLSITKLLDKYSTPLLTKELAGQATLRAILYFTNVTVAGVAYDEMEFDMNNVYVTSFQTSSSGDVPLESISLGFTKLTMITHVNGVTAQVTYNIAANTTS